MSFVHTATENNSSTYKVQLGKEFTKNPLLLKYIIFITSMQLKSQFVAQFVALLLITVNQIIFCGSGAKTKFIFTVLIINNIKTMDYCLRRYFLCLLFKKHMEGLILTAKLWLVPQNPKENLTKAHETLLLVCCNCPKGLFFLSL